MEELSEQEAAAIRFIMRSVGGIVFVPQDDFVVAWLGLLRILRGNGYAQPEQFRSDLTTSQPRAVQIAKRVLEDRRREYGASTGLGVHMGGRTFHRLQFGDLVGVCGTILTKEIRVS